MRTMLGCAGVAAVLTIPWSGCSLIGLAVDASERPDTLSVGTDFRSLEGKIVAVTLRDGYTVAGECRRLGRLTGGVYRERFERWREMSGGGIIPFEPDDTVSIRQRDGLSTSGVFEGFTDNALLILAGRNARELFPGSQRLESIPVVRVDSLRSTGGPWCGGRFLESLLGKGSLPRVDAMLLKRRGESTWVPIDEIAQVCEIRYSYAWFKAGAIADAVALVCAGALLAMRNN